MGKSHKYNFKGKKRRKKKKKGERKAEGSGNVDILI